MTSPDPFADLRIPSDYGRNPRRPKFSGSRRARRRRAEPRRHDAAARTGDGRGVARDETKRGRRRAAAARLGLPQHPPSSRDHPAQARGRAIDRRDPRRQRRAGIQRAPHGARRRHRDAGNAAADGGVRRLGGVSVAAGERRASSGSTCRTGAATASASSTSRGIGRKSRRRNASAKTRAAEASAEHSQEGIHYAVPFLLLGTGRRGTRSARAERAFAPRPFANGSSRRAARRSSSRCARSKCGRPRRTRSRCAFVPYR